MPPSCPWASYQIRKPVCCACAGYAGNVTQVPWCMSGSITRGGGENVPGTRRMRNPCFYISGKRPIDYDIWQCCKQQSGKCNASVFVILILGVVQGSPVTKLRPFTAISFIYQVFCTNSQIRVLPKGRVFCMADQSFISFISILD